MSNPDRSPPDNVVIRPATESDMDLVYSSWMKSYKRRSELPHRIYYKVMQYMLDRILKRPPAQVAVACFAKNPEQIFGWIAYEHVGDMPHVYYVYTKAHFRGMNIASALIAHATKGQPFVYEFRPRHHKPFIERGGTFNNSFMRGDLPE